MATHAPRGGRATLAGVAVVCGVALAALGPHVFAGGFHVDDWVDASHYYFHPGEGFWAAVRNHQDVKRDVYAVLRTAIYALFGMHTAPHLALTALVATAEASLLLVLLRRLGLAAAPATMAALLLLVWPDADSTRLWSTGFQMGLFAGLLPLAGLLVALRGLEQPGWRGAALHGVALALYATGVNGYELGAPMIMLFGILYVWHRPGSAARWRWAADVIVVLSLLIRYAGRHPHLPAIVGVPDHLRIIASHGLEVMARALLPVRGIPAAAVLAPALAIVVAAAVAVSCPQLAVRTRVELRQALLLLVGGLVVTVAGWGMIIPAAPGYDPGSSGVGNRINAVAAIGLAWSWWRSPVFWPSRSVPARAAPPRSPCSRPCSRCRSRWPIWCGFSRMPRIGTTQPTSDAPSWSACASWSPTRSRARRCSRSGSRATRRPRYRSSAAAETTTSWVPSASPTVRARSAGFRCSGGCSSPAVRPR
jgi:hypothetical protein